MRAMAILAILQLGTAAAAQVPGKAIVELPDRVALESRVRHPVGEERRFGLFQAIVDWPLGYPVVAAIGGGTEFAINGISFRFEAGDRLVKVARFKGSGLESLPATALITCSTAIGYEEIKARNSNLPKFDVMKRVGGQARPCLIDADNDGQFEKAFFTNQTVPTDRIIVPIQPVPYALGENLQADDSSVSLRLIPDSFVTVLQFFEEGKGKPMALGFYELPDLFPPDSIKADKIAVKEWKKTHLSSLLGDPFFHSDFFPMDLPVGNGMLKLVGYDRKGRIMTVRMEKPTTPFRIRTSGKATTIIYY